MSKKSFDVTNIILVANTAPTKQLKLSVLNTKMCYLTGTKVRVGKVISLHI